MEDKNLVLAEFVGAVVLGQYLGADGGYSDSKLLDFCNAKDAKGNKLYPENQRYWSHNTLKYHTSWEWLMPVFQLTLKHSAEHHDDALRFYIKDTFPFHNIIDLWEDVYEYVKDLKKDL